MGNIRNAQQRHREALEYHERALENMKATLGEKHYFTGDIARAACSSLCVAAVNDFIAASRSSLLIHRELISVCLDETRRKLTLLSHHFLASSSHRLGYKSSRSVAQILCLSSGL